MQRKHDKPAGLIGALRNGFGLRNGKVLSREAAPTRVSDQELVKGVIESFRFLGHGVSVEYPGGPDQPPGRHNVCNLLYL